MTEGKMRKVLQSSSEARKRVLEELVPKALDALLNLLTVEDHKTLLSAIELTLESAEVKGKASSGSLSTPITLNSDQMLVAIQGLNKIKDAKVVDIEEKGRELLAASASALPERAK